MNSSATQQEIPSPPDLPVGDGRYRARFVRTPEDLDGVLKLRYDVFNVELEEGLERSHRDGRDRDRFDEFCHHLLVEDASTRQIVGTYRMQTQAMAHAGAGFYAATEFDLGGFSPDLLARSLEIGRACIARDHRNLKVLYMLWRGLGTYLSSHGLRYLFGCCSLTSQDPDEATRVYHRLLRDGNIDALRSITPLETHRCIVSAPGPGSDHIPRLMRTYLSLGAQICSTPAIDRDFKTIDYLALFDLSSMSPSRLAFFGVL